jgi:hypothetical protein
MLATMSDGNGSIRAGREFRWLDTGMRADGSIFPS